MKCPSCSNMENKVVDSRTNRDGDLTRRRRECLNCGERFTTYERIERTPLLIVKQDGRREEFNRNKILSGVQKACQKRPVSVDQMENLVDGIERYFQDAGEKEISAVTVGEKVVRSCTAWTASPMFDLLPFTAISRTSTNSWPSSKASSKTRIFELQPIFSFSSLPAFSKIVRNSFKLKAFLS